MDNCEQILNYLKTLNPKNQGLSGELYKDWQNAMANNDKDLCAHFQLLAYYDACKIIADWYIFENKNVEDFKDATQDIFFFISKTTPKTKHYSNFKQEFKYYLKVRLDRIEKNKLEHNLYLHHDWSPDIKELPDTDIKHPIEKVIDEERTKTIMKQFSLLKYPRKKHFLLRYCGITGKSESMREIAKKEGMSAGGVQFQIANTLTELRKKNSIRQIGRELNKE
ncbi:MAG: sigma-70 family RNA polymerase sigma factor [Clostridia bacterium]|nr:sigma-70 family RNA polymerase sigma factor [Clostridia bacterium]